MTEAEMSVPDVIRSIHAQFEDFLQSEELRDLYRLLNTDAAQFQELFDSRKRADGRVAELQDVSGEIDADRTELYRLLKKLGFIDINQPLKKEHNRILILGGSMNACFERTGKGVSLIDDAVLYFDGLSCYRPLSPRERKLCGFPCGAETEFGAMNEAFRMFLRLEKVRAEEDFRGDRNLNRIRNLITYDTSPYTCRVFAVPSEEPKMRRADTGDSFRMYLKQEQPGPKDAVLAVTNNIHCNRQFIQLLYEMLGMNTLCFLDVVGCTEDEELAEAETFDPRFYLQELIALLQWIDRFTKDYPL